MQVGNDLEFHVARAVYHGLFDRRGSRAQCLIDITAVPMSSATTPLRLLISDSAGNFPDALLDELGGSAWGPFQVERCDAFQSAMQRLAASRHDAFVWSTSGATGDAPMPGLSDAALATAVVVVTAQPAPGTAARLVAIGVQDVLPADSLDAAALARALRLGIERKRIELSARRAYATDLSTGLPSHTQLLEHMNQLFALREREPAPVALIVLRVEGLRTLETELGAESAQVLRRKVAVRLRAGLRASDVVAAHGAESYAVLLSAMESPDHGRLVGDKLLASLRRPFTIGGRPVAVAAAAGIARHPEDGRTAEELLRVAVAAASVSPAVGRPGRGAGAVRAANDES